MKLIYITNNFPYEYNGGEVMFVAPELNCISSEFDEIIIAPVKNGGIVYDMPSNCVLDSGLSNSLSVGRLFLLVNLLKEILKIQISLAVLVEIVSSLKWGWIGFINCLYWTCQAVQVKKWILKNYGALDSVVVYTYWNCSATVGAVFAANKNGNFKVVTRAHGYDLYVERSSPSYIPYRDYVYKKLDKVVLISNFGVKYLEKKYPNLASKFLLSRLGTADPGFLAERSAENIFNIVSCSFVVPVKRLKLIADVVSLLVKRNPEFFIKWTHIGGGDGLEELKKYSDSILSPDNKNFIGHLNNVQVIDFYRNNAVDIFLNLSESEGIPVSMMEVSSMGIPIIATNVGGVSEVVEGVNGSLVSDMPNILDVVICLERFMKMPSENISDLRAGARAVWERKFNLVDNHNNFSKILKSVLES